MCFYLSMGWREVMAVLQAQLMGWLLRRLQDPLGIHCDGVLVEKLRR